MPGRQDALNVRHCFGYLFHLLGPVCDEKLVGFPYDARRPLSFGELNGHAFWQTGISVDGGEAHAVGFPVVNKEKASICSAREAQNAPRYDVGEKLQLDIRRCAFGPLGELLLLDVCEAGKRGVGRL